MPGFIKSKNLGVCRKKEVIVSVSSAEEALCVTKFLGTILRAIAAWGDTSV